MRAALRAVLFGPSLLSRVLSIPGLSALYDPSDLTSIYQSRTGGSTGAVDSVVGIMLDKHLMGGKTAANFIAGQSDLLGGDGAFASATGWTVGANWSITGGAAVATGTSSNLYYAMAVQAYTWYVVSLDITAYTSGTLAVDIGGGANATTTGTGIKTPLLYSGAASLQQLRLYGGTIAATIDNVSVKAIPGYHALAPSDAARPILRAGPYIDFDGVDDVLNAVIGANLGASCSVYHRTQAGAHVWLDAQTINSGNYAMSTTDWRKAAIFSSLPTGTEKAIVEAWGAAA